MAWRSSALCARASPDSLERDGLLEEQGARRQLCFSAGSVSPLKNDSFKYSNKPFRRASNRKKGKKHGEEELRGIPRRSSDLLKQLDLRGVRVKRPPRSRPLCKLQVEVPSALASPVNVREAAAMATHAWDGSAKEGVHLPLSVVPFVWEVCVHISLER